jgi:hypothetical protein
VQFSRELKTTNKEASSNTSVANRKVDDASSNKIIEAEFNEFMREGPLTEIKWNLRPDHGYCVYPINETHYLFCFSKGPEDGETPDEWQSLMKSTIIDHLPAIVALVKNH